MSRGKDGTEDNLPRWDHPGIARSHADPVHSLLCEATIAVGKHVLRCCREQGFRRGGRIPVAHIQHAWTERRDGYEMTIRWVTR